eukprot:CAMPEP_0197852140 /NCGR_PEP_ID=MMETSP1438-20131217/19741_1 /TAXON_ID=1461541 /ORGANISM="Pterosperma sp., Strain CCMP1384" /LENGTH=115 /DNA_ID=CAMNT_0043466019 /DNA_START=768 /DNA_END=1116 /DNA_ORIENTATION=-
MPTDANRDPDIGEWYHGGKLWRFPDESLVRMHILIKEVDPREDSNGLDSFLDPDRGPDLVNGQPKSIFTIMTSVLNIMRGIRKYDTAPIVPIVWPFMEFFHVGDVMPAFWVEPHP